MQNFVKEGKSEPLKYRLMKIKGLGIPPIDYTPSGMPTADTPAIKVLAGNPEKGTYGKAYDHFKSIGKEEEGKVCCLALENWLKFKQIETLL
jgi:DNA polymerase-1